MNKEAWLSIEEINFNKQWYEIAECMMMPPWLRGGLKKYEGTEILKKFMEVYENKHTSSISQKHSKNNINE